MQVQFASSFKVQVEATAIKMVTENLDVCEIPESLGTVLVRVGSAEFRRRLEPDSHIWIVPKPGSVDGRDFVVCSC